MYSKLAVSLDVLLVSVIMPMLRWTFRSCAFRWPNRFIVHFGLLARCRIIAGWLVTDVNRRPHDFR